MKTEPDKKEIMRCVNCKSGIKIAYDIVAQEGDSTSFYFCDNPKCDRYGLASIVWS